MDWERIVGLDSSGKAALPDRNLTVRSILFRLAAIDGTRPVDATPASEAG